MIDTHLWITLLIGLTTGYLTMMLAEPVAIWGNYIRGKLVDGRHNAIWHAIEILSVLFFILGIAFVMFILPRALLPSVYHWRGYIFAFCGGCAIRMPQYILWARGRMHN